MEAKGLLIRQPFAYWIVDGKKTWEIRGSATKVRSRIAIIVAGTGTVVGTCKLRAWSRSTLKRSLTMEGERESGCLIA